MKNKLIKGLFLVLGIMVLLLPFSKVIADSGWDSSYSSGGGSSSSSGGGYSSGGSSSSSGGYSSSGSSSSSRSKSSSSYSYSSSRSKSNPLLNILGIFSVLFVLGLPLIISIGVILEERKKRKSKFGSSTNSYSMKLMTQEEIDNIDSNIKVSEFMPKVFDLFVDVQKAWMDFDYDNLRNLLGDELFNNYKMQLETLELENGKNIMDNFTYIGGGILSITKNGLTEEVKVKLHIQMHDYVINTVTNETKHGDPKKIMDNIYVITLERSIREEIHNCPNCGGELKDTASQKCPYCDAVLVKGSKDFVMVKKENVSGMYH